jgi:hypothetical protein
MTAAKQEAKELSLPTPTQEPNMEETLTDVIDHWSRKAFQRSLERRHAAPSYRTFIESALLVRTTQS